jgi:hypothetical protein
VQDGLWRPVPDAGSHTNAERPVSPAQEYTRRLEQREAGVAKLTATHERIGTARLLVAALGLLAAWASLHAHLLPAAFLWIALIAFVALVVWHQQVQRSRTRAQRAVAFYQQGLARIEDRWQGEGATGERFDDPHHVYASDLDLFGRGSLFQLLCTARTRMGEEQLARWLLTPAPVAEIRRRHASLSELRGRVDLREDIAVLGEEGVGVHPDRLLAWAETPNALSGPWIPACVLILAPLAVATLILWGITSIAWPFVLVLMAEILVLRTLHHPINEVLVGSEQAFENLRLFAAILMRLEREPFQSAPLRALTARLSTGSVTGARAIHHLATIVNLAGSRRNQMMAMLAVPLMYPLAVAILGERWRARHGAQVRTWVEVVGELEALLALAAYAHEHPGDPFPELKDGPACFIGRQVGHPLLPARP